MFFIPSNFNNKNIGITKLLNSPHKRHDGDGNTRVFDSCKVSANTSITIKKYISRIIDTSSEIIVSVL